MLLKPHTATPHTSVPRPAVELLLSLLPLGCAAPWLCSTRTPRLLAAAAAGAWDAPAAGPFCAAVAALPPFAKSGGCGGRGAAGHQWRCCGGACRAVDGSKAGGGPAPPAGAASKLPECSTAPPAPPSCWVLLSSLWHTAAASVKSPSASFSAWRTWEGAGQAGSSAELWRPAEDMPQHMTQVQTRKDTALLLQHTCCGVNSGNSSSSVRAAMSSMPRFDQASCLAQRGEF